MTETTPFDILELILAHLHDDFPTLSQCSLVGREWLSLCRRWLFESVDLTNTGYRPTTRTARFTKFMNLASNRSIYCTFSPFVQQLQLDSTFTPYQIAGLSTVHFPSLRSIRIKGCSTCVPPYLLSAVSTTFSDRIDRLDIAGVRFPTLPALIEFVCAFPKLEALTLGDNLFSQETGSETHQHVRLANALTSLRIMPGLALMDRDLIAWLHGQVEEGCTGLKRLAMGSQGMFFPLGIVRALVDRLEVIEAPLNMLDQDTSRGFWSTPVHSPRLHTLRLVCPIRGIEQAPDGTLARAVESLTAPDLRELSIVFQQVHSGPNEPVCGTCLLNRMSLPRLDKVLASRNSGSLPMLGRVEVLAQGFVRHSNACRGDVVRRLDLGDEADAGAGRSDFDAVASRFLTGSFPSSLSRCDMTFQALQVKR